MTNFTDYTGLASNAVVLATAIQLLPAVARIARNRQAMLSALVFVLALIPYNGMSIAAYLRGYLGDLSITGMVLVFGVLLRPWSCCRDKSHLQRNTLLAAIAVGALLLYPMALGVGANDPYRPGYGDPLFVGVLLLMALGAWYREQRTLALCISLSMLAWAMGWYESGNLWDYLLDPFVVIYALTTLLSLGIKRLWQAVKQRD